MIRHGNTLTRRSPFTTALAILLALPLLAVSAVAQQPLPDSLKANISLATGRFAAQMQHLDAAPGEILQIYVTFKNDGDKSVTIEWQFKAASALAGFQTDIQTTSFHPTAICARAGKTRTFFVAGWAERGARLVVEEWRLPQVSLGVANPVGGGNAQTLLVKAAGSSLRKTEIFSSAGAQGIGPVLSIAYNPFGDKLLLLPVEGPKRILVVDVDSGSIEQTVLVSDFDTELESTWALKSGLHLDRGLVIATRAQATWVKPTPIVAGQPESPILIMEDSDLDGTIDFIDVLVGSVVPVAYPPDRWNATFVEE